MKIDPAVSAYMQAIGRRGGRTTGPAKARSSEQARNAALARWKDPKAVQRWRENQKKKLLHKALHLRRNGRKVRQ